MNLGDVALIRGDLAEAARWLARTFRRWSEVTRIDTLAWALMLAGELAARRGQAEAAVTIFGAEQSVEERFGIALHPLYRAKFERILEETRAALGSGAEEAWARGREMELGEAAGMAIAGIGG
jgi:hypothetical protein